MKKIILVSALLVAAPVSPVHAEGALAVGVAEGGPKNGYAYTLNVRNKTAAAAEKEAMEGCRAQAQVYGVPPARCRLVASFRNKCVSVAFDAQERAAGWDLGDTAEQATANAVRKCAENGARNCKPHNVECDR